MHLICGAGFAGLTLANILEQLGEDYLVVEKHPSIRAEGAFQQQPGSTCSGGSP